MFTQYLTTDKVNALNPEAVCVAHNSGDGDLYTTTGAELMADHPGLTLSQALDSLLDDMRRDSFEILAVNSAGQIIQIQPVE